MRAAAETDDPSPAAVIEMDSCCAGRRHVEGFRRCDFDLLEGRSFWYNAYNLTLMDFRSRISFCVDNRSEIRDSRAIENTKCQNDKIIFIFCRYQP